jgi:hypothetical protein
LGEEIVEGNGEGKMQPVDQFSVHRGTPVAGDAACVRKTIPILRCQKPDQADRI